MKFVHNGNRLEEVKNDILEDMRTIAPLSTAFIVDVPRIKESIKSRSKNFLTNSNLSYAGITLGSQGIFWKAFLVYIFPWMLDIAKVYCAIKICQSFYQEKRGGRDEGTGFGSLVQYGKWYLVFWLIPWGVELIDQIGGTMFNDLQKQGIQLDSPAMAR